MEGMVEGTVEVQWRMVHSMPEGIREGQQRNRLRGAQGLPAPLKGWQWLHQTKPQWDTWSKPQEHRGHNHGDQ